MFADFSLTDSGDLLIVEKPESIQIQKISFNISNFKTQKINFDSFDNLFFNLFRVFRERSKSSSSFL